MPFCCNCGNELELSAKYCSHCGNPVKKKVGETYTERKQEYLGIIVKCPSCGAEVPSMTAMCPECGHEFNSIEIPDDVRQFFQEIKECDLKIAAEQKKTKGWSVWSSGQKFWWIFLNIFTAGIPALIRLSCPLIAVIKSPELGEIEQKKTTLIQNFTLPDDRKAILYTLRFINEKVSSISCLDVTGIDKYWAKLWKEKSDEIIKHARFVLPNDSKVTEISSEIKQSYLKINRKVVFKVLSFLGILLAIALILYIFRNKESTIQ